MCLRKGMSPEDIRAVTGHTTADMMMKYVKFDDESKREKMSILNENAQSGVETVFDHAITVDERIRLGLPTRETYLEIFEGDTASVNAHLVVLAHIRGNLDARANYIKRLPHRQTQRSPRNHHERYLTLYGVHVELIFNNFYR